MNPVAAAAAHDAGDARKMAALPFPIRPLKFLLAVETTFTPSGGMGPVVPQQGPQPGGVIVAPNVLNFSRVPSAVNAASISLEAGVATK